MKFVRIELMEGVRLSYRYTKLENPRGERSKDALRLDPGAPGLKVEFHGTKVTSDAGFKKAVSGNP